MKLSSIHLLPLLLLTLLAALTVWLERATVVDGGRNDGKGRHDPDFIVDNFTVRRYSISGAVQYVATAPKMLHYADDESTQVVSPALIYFGADRRTRINAGKAWISKEGKEVRLSDDVRVVREATADSPELVVTTAEMLIYPDDEVARSTRPTTITQGRSIITGTGLDADNKTLVFKLMGRARGIIYRNKADTP
jgi:lipopolysaccharide export system protein LptC